MAAAENAVRGERLRLTLLDVLDEGADDAPEPPRRSTARRRAAPSKPAESTPAADAPVDLATPRDGALPDIVPPEVTGTTAGSSIAPAPTAPTPSEVPIAAEDLPIAGAAFTSLSVVEERVRRADEVRANIRRTDLGEWYTSVDAILRARNHYPEERAALGVGGVVTVEFVVDRKGRVRDVRVVASWGTRCWTAPASARCRARRRCRRADTAGCASARPSATARRRSHRGRAAVHS